MGVDRGRHPDSPEEPDRREAAEVSPEALGPAPGVLPTPAATALTGPEVADWSYANRRLATVLVLVLVAIVLWISRPVLPIVLVAAIVAHLVAPVVRRLERRGMRRGLAVGLVYLSLLVVGGLLLVLVVPRLINEVEKAALALARFLATGQTETEAFLTQFRSLEIGPFTADLSPAVDRLLAVIAAAQIPTDMAALQPFLGPVRQALMAASNLFVGAVGLFVRAALAFAVSLYLSLEAPALMASLDSFMDREQSAESRELLRRVGESWTGFLRGQFILMAVIGVVVTAGGLILGLPGALALGLLAGILEVLPNLGPVLATLPAVAIALVAGSQVLAVPNWIFALIVLFFYILVQQLENNLLVPRVLGRAVALPSVVVMVAVIVGAEVGGILGAFVAAPAAATLREVLAYTVDKIRGRDPYPELRGGPRPEDPAAL